MNALTYATQQTFAEFKVASDYAGNFVPLLKWIASEFIEVDFLQ